MYPLTKEVKRMKYPIWLDNTVKHSCVINGKDYGLCTEAEAWKILSDIQKSIDSVK